MNNLLDNLRSKGALVCHSHIGSECAVWDPLGGCTRSGLFEHTINLLKGQTLCLRNEEVCINEAESTERSPDEEYTRSQVGILGLSANHVWGDDSDNAVPEPVAGSGEPNTTGTDGKRENFTDDDPGTYEGETLERDHQQKVFIKRNHLPGPQVVAKKKM
jgi:hypothetical protein